uniref:DNA fragmentation factor subunit beta n=1 Tax=Myxine glutinosa TaxID=7769 RepID=UPI00358FA63C
MLPFRIRSTDGNRRVGIVARNLHEVRLKAALKLNLGKATDLQVRLEDSTDIEDDDFLLSLPAHTRLVILRPNETWRSDGLTNFFAALEVLESGSIHERRESEALIDRSLAANNVNHGQRVVLQEFKEQLMSQAHLESRMENPAWFEGLSPRFHTKCDVMRHNCLRRLRGYVREAQKAWRNIGPPQCTEVMLYLNSILKTQGGTWFDRSASGQDRFCTCEGWFTCQGTFNSPRCVLVHSINPYASWEKRVLFSTWNLDHRIEKGRMVIPEFRTAVWNCPNGQRVNEEYFGDLLIGRGNLKLVAPSCHDKQNHNLGLDRQQIYKMN